MNSPFVLDSSVALSWLLPDENNAAADALLEQIVLQPVLAPALWLLETNNALLAVRRAGRIDQAMHERLRGHVAALPVEFDAAFSYATMEKVALLAARHGLSVYDAVYLELAARRSLPLATLDRALSSAARAENLTVLPDVPKRRSHDQPP